jgi:hypothetical protein
MKSRESFGQMHFGAVELGDQRRNRRLPRLADELVRHPGGTLPEKLPKPEDLEAFYRLCAADDVTHAAVLAPHRERVLQKLQTSLKTLLVVHDATEFDFSSRTSLKHLGQIGNGLGRGYIVQQSLVVDPERGTVEGLANQILHTRADVPKEEGVAAKRERESRESLLWLRGTEGLPARRQVVDVCDRGADTFEFLEHESQSGRTFVVRVQHDRAIQPGHADADAETISLFEYVRSLPAQGSGQVPLRLPAKQRAKSKRDLPATRIAQLQMSAAPIRLAAPHVHRGFHGNDALVLWVVRIWEPDPPEGCEPLEWILFTNHPCPTVRAIRVVKGWYEWRWVIEEFHKGQKTGCDIERLQFRQETRLEPALALLSIVALTLLQLRDAARDPAAHTRRADELVSPEAILVLSQWSEGRPRLNWTLHDYALALAKLGGYRRRKNCPPGWLVLWRGHTKLELMLDGVRTFQKTQNKCAKR